MACERSIISKWCAKCGVDQQTVCPAPTFAYPAKEAGRREPVYEAPANQNEKPARKRLIDTDSAERKTYPLATGLLDYFPDALAEVANLSYISTAKHHPGEPMHHARGKSSDHADCIMRHLSGRGGFDGETRESAALAWRALALLQEELEREHTLPLPRGAK